MLYQIQATVTRTNGKYSTTKQIPTFYLDGDIQGIVDSNHAASIAKSIIDIFDNPDIEISVAAYGFLPDRLLKPV